MFQAVLHDNDMQVAVDVVGDQRVALEVSNGRTFRSNAISRSGLDIVGSDKPDDISGGQRDHRKTPTFTRNKRFGNSISNFRISLYGPSECRSSLVRENESKIQ